MKTNSFYLLALLASAPACAETLSLQCPETLTVKDSQVVDLPSQWASSIKPIKDGIYPFFASYVTYRSEPDSTGLSNDSQQITSTTEQYVWNIGDGKKYKFVCNYGIESSGYLEQVYIHFQLEQKLDSCTVTFKKSKKKRSFNLLECK